MSLNAVRLRVLKLSIIVSIVSGKVERKKEPLILSNLNIFVMAFPTVCDNAAQRLAILVQRWWNLSRWRHIACVSVETSSQVCPGFCGGVAAGDRHSEVAVDCRNKHNDGLVVVSVPVILSVACGV
jgi:hypothetical protein